MERKLLTKALKPPRGHIMTRNQIRNTVCVSAFLFAGLGAGCDDRQPDYGDTSAYPRPDPPGDVTTNDRRPAPAPEVRDGSGEELHNPDSAFSVQRRLDEGRVNELQPEFDNIDGNGDGAVTAAEWRNMGTLPKPFTSADLNNDGRLTREEYLDAMNDEVVSESEFEERQK
jgi:hypothetical protein